MLAFYTGLNEPLHSYKNQPLVGVYKYGFHARFFISVLAVNKLQTKTVWKWVVVGSGTVVHRLPHILKGLSLNSSEERVFCIF